MLKWLAFDAADLKFDWTEVKRLDINLPQTVWVDLYW